MKFSTSKYKTSHARSPRGYGRWLFECNLNQFVFTGSLSEAKKEAADHFKKEMGMAASFAICEILP